MKLPEEEHENGERWLLTYSDLITLLMIFFVVMYTMSTVDAQKFSALEQSLNLAMGGGGGGESVVDLGNPVPNPAPTIPGDQVSSLEEVKIELDKYLAENHLDHVAVTLIDETGLLIRLKDSILFESAKADVKPDLANTLVSIGKILSKAGCYIRVDGHTDNIPIHNAKFNSNWELSAIRATTVVQLLVNESGIPSSKIAALGYGENRPIADNSTADGRAKNRRVDIVVISSQYSKIEDIKR